MTSRNEANLTRTCESGAHARPWSLQQTAFVMKKVIWAAQRRESTVFESQMHSRGYERKFNSVARVKQIKINDVQEIKGLRSDREH